MKRTTVVMEDEIFRQVKTKAARENKKLQACVNDLLRIGLSASKAFDPKKLPPLPTFKAGMKANFDPGSREHLYPPEDDEVRMGPRRAAD